MHAHQRALDSQTSCWNHRFKHPSRQLRSSDSMVDVARSTIGAFYRNAPRIQACASSYYVARPRLPINNYDAAHDEVIPSGTHKRCSSTVGTQVLAAAIAVRGHATVGPQYNMRLHQTDSDCVESRSDHTSVDPVHVYFSVQLWLPASSRPLQSAVLPKCSQRGSTPLSTLKPYK